MNVRDVSSGRLRVSIRRAMMKLEHRGEIRNECAACLALERALACIYRVAQCLSGTGHVSAADLLRDIDLLRGACAAARRQAAAQLTAVAAAILAAEEPEPEPKAIPNNEQLLDAPAMAARLGVPVSKVRSDQRLGKIPAVMVGRWVRFRPAEVLAAYQKVA
jgi:hypothetical protein